LKHDKLCKVYGQLIESHVTSYRLRY